MNSYLIIYHKEDNDGVFSAAIAAEYICKTYKDAVIDTIPADYVSTASFTTDDFILWEKTYNSVIMTDISISNPKMMKDLYKILKNKLVWIDHHAPAIKSSIQYKYAGIHGERSTERSAILLAWKFFFDQLDESYISGKTPYILRILSAWDSFTFEKEGIDKDFARDVNVGVTDYFKLSLPRVRMFVNEIINNGENAGNVKYFMENGHLINKHNDWTMTCTVNDYGDFSWEVDGRPAVALFLQQATSSLIFSCVKDSVSNGLIFKRKPDGCWVVSIYNTNNDDTFHCGEYVKEKYGGGGHVGAAGCTLTEKQFLKILKSKKF